MGPCLQERLPSKGTCPCSPAPRLHPATPAALEQEESSSFLGMRFPVTSFRHIQRGASYITQGAAFLKFKV